MNLQNAVNFKERPAGVGTMYEFARVARRQAYRGTAGAFDAVAPIGGGAADPVAPADSGGLTTAQGLQFAGQLAGALAGLATGIYSSQLQKQQAEQQADLQKKALDLQKNQQALTAYQLLASQQGRDVAYGVTPSGGGNVLSGGAAIAAVVALGALLLLR
jgi:hypothetical protein